MSAIIVSGRQTNRQSNWELLRIVAMLMIVAGHFFQQSGFIRSASAADYWFSIFAGSGSRIAVNMFLMLGCWFMVDTKFKAHRIIKLYLNVWCFTVPLTILVVCLGFSPTMKDVARGIFPFVGKGLWFASAYIMLILFSPWLHKVLEWKEYSIRNLLIVSFLLIGVWVTFWTIDRTEDQWLDIVVWFSFMYVFIGYYKHHVQLKINKYYAVAAGIIAYLVLAGVSGYCGLYSADSEIMKSIGRIFTAFLSDYKTFTNFFISCCFFYFFQRLTMPNSKIINYIASGAFTTYIVHQTPAFIHVLWYNIFQCDYFVNGNYKSVYSIVVILSTYIGCLILERIRKRWVEKNLLKAHVILSIEKKIDRFYTGC